MAYTIETETIFSAPWIPHITMDSEILLNTT